MKKFLLTCLIITAFASLKPTERCFTDAALEMNDKTACNFNNQ